jgi:hypothetical protein
MATWSVPRGVIRVPLPDTYQQTDYTCGVASVKALSGYFGVGPRTEQECLLDMRVPKGGADPEHIMRGFRTYALDFMEYYPMSVGRLRASVDRGRPVILMLQAWGTVGKGKTEHPRLDYEGWFEDGHWVVAIGYDAEGVYFEDPSILHARGFLAFSELDARWHDWGPKYEHMYYYGISVWQSQPGQRARRRSHTRRVMHIH